MDTVTHWKSLVTSHQSYFNSIADYAEQAKLKGDTVVDVSFLEQELAVANNRSKQMVEQQHTELKTILSNIEDIIHITPFSTDAFEDDISAAEQKRTDTITAVEELDNQLSSEYEMLDPFYESVQFNVNSLEQLTSQGGSAYQLAFDAKAYKNSDAYKTQQQIDKIASGYVEDKVEQKQEIKQRKAAIEAERQRQIQANKPWYEKGLDIAGELTGYYDYKRAVEGVDPVTHTKLSTTQRVTAGAMAAAGFIPFVGWAGRAVKGGSVVYKTAKSMSAAHHAMALYQTPKAFKALEQTEKGLYGLVLTNGMYEYTTGKDVLGNKLTKEQQQASLFQSFWIAAGGVLASKVGNGVDNVQRPYISSEIKNTLSHKFTNKKLKTINKKLKTIKKNEKNFISTVHYLKNEIKNIGEINLPLPRRVKIVEQALTGIRIPVATEWIKLKDLAHAFTIKSNGTQPNLNHPVRVYRNISDEILNKEYTIVTKKGTFTTRVMADKNLIVEMPFVGKGKSSTNSEGWLRDHKYYFKELYKQHPEYFSKANIENLENGWAIKNDAVFRRYLID
ncbi:hypothetical protein AS180_19530 [Priestia veravalensis]|uniref:LXG domain-containing protein n=1 Tax=Priestia veravalensis TaxID=1414648 RepID=A0A0V8JGY4_9BACI|nr:hypothetical protein AS180_19530 [Priestia veravalensis]SCC55014.1 Predicted ribonuclease, toxin component of the YeeF-YezG toxin-antitoxin module [Priestia flexa]